MLKTPLGFQNFGHRPLYFGITINYVKFFNLIIDNIIINLNYLIMFDFIVWLVLFFIVCITKVVGLGIGVYICWYLYKKFGEKHAPVVLDQYKKGDK